MDEKNTGGLCAPPQFTDAELLAGMQNNEEMAWIEFVVRYNNLLQNYARHFVHDFHSAEDVAQEAFTQFVRRFHQTEWESLDAVRATLLARTRHRAIDYYKKKMQFKQFPENYDTVKVIDIDLTVSSEPSELMRVIHRMPEQQRRVFGLKHTEGLTHEEIAKALKISIPASRALLHKAYRFIREEMNQE